MDFNCFPDSSKRGSTINPADLHADLNADQFASYFDSSLDNAFCEPGSLLPDLAAVDSAVDLRSFEEHWPSNIKLEADEQPHMDQFFEMTSLSQTSNTPSPANEMIFSNANSPGDYLRGGSHTTSPDTNDEFVAQTIKSPPVEDWKLFQTADAIHIPQPVEQPQVYLTPDKTKTRAETQIKVQLVLDPLDDRFSHLHFPRKTLAKPKLLATEDERMDIKSQGGDAVYMDMYLVCATAVDNKPERMEQALRRARGEEKIPTREKGVPIAELDKDDPAHPQNGGEVVICEGCKEREKKRYDRKKKKAEEEGEWKKFEDERIIMINEKEFKKWKDVDSNGTYTARAKQIEFAMRITCYCRHQEEKSPVGYRVIFTFKDGAGNFIAQQTSDIFQITDDHKNKELAPEGLRPLNIPHQGFHTPYGGHPNVVPVYNFPVEGQYAAPAALPVYSQPQTPVMPTFQTPMSPMDERYPHSTTTPTQPPRHHATYSNPPSFQRSSTFEAPMLSPTQMSPDHSYLPRPVSMDNFNFASSMQYPQHNGFASAPPSAVSTPINLSRPASPTWEQGPQKKKMVCMYFYVDDKS